MVMRWRRVQGMAEIYDLRWMIDDFRTGRGADGDRVAGRIFFVEGDDDFFFGGGRERETDVVGGDGEAVVAAVDEDGEFDLGGAAVIEKLVEGGLDGAAGEEDVVDEDDDGAVDVGGEDGGGELFRDRVAADIVAVKGDVEGAGLG